MKTWGSSLQPACIWFNKQIQCKIHQYEYQINSMQKCDWASKRDQVGTKNTTSQNGTYLEFCVQCLLSVSCRMFPVKLLIDGTNLTCIALADH